jgi:predicted ATP-dependent endonuclease of OLD family
MKLKKVLIKNYRSIVDSGVVDIEEKVTVLIGKNEQGKTTFLKAINSFDKTKNYAATDFPNHLRPELEKKDKATIPIVSFWMFLEAFDIEKLKAYFLEIIEAKELVVTKFYDNHYEYRLLFANGEEKSLSSPLPSIDVFISEIKAEGELLKSKLIAHSTRFPTFLPALPQATVQIDSFIKSDFNDHDQIRNLIKTFVTGLKGLPGQDQLIINEISSSAKVIQDIFEKIQSELAKDPFSILHRDCFPKILFHSNTLDKIPDGVPTIEFVKDPETVSRGMFNLCNVAGLSIQKIQELANSDASQRESYEDHHNGAISGSINEFWSQEKYHIHFRIEKERLTVSISDDTYSNRIPPSGRSDGFQWFLSFYSTYLNDINSSEATILLLDNPGLELHPDGQRDIKKFLEEKLPSLTQTIYVTHSPSMVDPYNLKQIRRVELRPNKEGTKIVNSITKDGNDLDLLEPVRAALGASLISSLMFNDYNLLVEGAADKPILEAAFKTYGGDLKDKVFVNGSLSESKNYFLAEIYKRSGLPHIAFLDADSSGRRIAEDLRKILDPSKVLIINEIITDKGSEFELEDIFSKNLYCQAVRETYPELKDIEAPLENHFGKQTKYYSDLFNSKYGFDFTKKRVGDRIKQLIIENRIDEESKNNLLTIVGKILEAFKKTNN